jgi:hypothetical protein
MYTFYLSGHMSVRGGTLPDRGLHCCHALLHGQAHGRLFSACKRHACFVFRRLLESSGSVHPPHVVSVLCNPVTGQLAQPAHECEAAWCWGWAGACMFLFPQMHAEDWRLGRWAA